MDDQDDKRRLDERLTHNRLVLASVDLQEARTFALEVATNQDQLGRLVCEGLVAAAMVAYGRCFVSTRVVSPRARNVVPERFLSGLLAPDRQLHGRLLELRNEEFAHSDADAASIDLRRFQVDGEEIVWPDRRPLRRSFTITDVERMIGLCNALILRLNAEVADLQARMRTDATIPSSRVI